MKAIGIAFSDSVPEDFFAALTETPEEATAAKALHEARARINRSYHGESNGNGEF